MDTDADYTINDLARLTGLKTRTIRYWLAQGLIPASGESGPGAHYGQGHLDRLRLTKRLQEQHQPLAEIRRRLAEMTDADVGAVVAESDSAGTPPTSALDYVRSVLGPPQGLNEARPAYLRRMSVPAPTRAGRPSMPSMAPPRRPTLGSIAQLTPPAMRDPVEPPAEARDQDDSQPEPQPLERSQWERLSLGPNVELHIRRPLSRPAQKRVERLITIARQVLKEGK